MENRIRQAPRALALCATALAIVLSGTAIAQTRVSRPALEALPEEVQQFVLTWLTRDCSSADKLVLEGQLQAVGAPLEPVFWEAYRLGPPTTDLERDTAAIRRRYEVRQKWLAGNQGADLLGAEEVERLRGQDGEDYTTRELERITVGYRTAAILGLALVAGEGSTAALEAIAGDTENAAATAAAAALEAISGRQG
jgi:hypothetical protein